jgi:hypothetical protein
MSPRPIRELIGVITLASMVSGAVVFVSSRIGAEIIWPDSRLTTLGDTIRLVRADVDTLKMKMQVRDRRNLTIDSIVLDGASDRDYMRSLLEPLARLRCIETRDSNLLRIANMPCRTLMEGRRR